MSTANAAYGVLSTETDFQTFSALSLKPILQFITTECLASMPASGLNVVDFIMQLLTANRDILNQMFCGGSSSKQLDMHASSHRLAILPRSGASASARISELEARVRDARAPTHAVAACSARRMLRCRVTRSIAARCIKIPRCMPHLLKATARPHVLLYP
jgi:hypothetical protein